MPSNAEIVKAVLNVMGVNLTGIDPARSACRKAAKFLMRICA